MFIHSTSKLHRYLLVNGYQVMIGYLTLDSPKIKTAPLEKVPRKAKPDAIRDKKNLQNFLILLFSAVV